MENKLIAQKDKFKLIISEKLERKIRVLCEKFPKTEWSGQLFYTYTGSFANKDIVFTAEDLLFMDEGSAVDTEFYLDEGNAASYIADHELFGHQIGLIHSHNVMNAFFSGQDDSMLKQEGSSRNHFLSLVVNNAGNYVARVTTKEVITYSLTKSSEMKTFNNADIVTAPTTENGVETVVSYYDLDIVGQTNTCEDYDELMGIIAECAERKKQRAKREKPLLFKNPAYIPYGQSLFPELDSKELLGKTLADEEIDFYVLQLVTLNLLPYKEDLQQSLNTMYSNIHRRFKTQLEYEHAVETIAEYVIAEELYKTFTDEDDYIQAIDTIITYIKSLKYPITTDPYLKFICNTLESYK